MLKTGQQIYSQNKELKTNTQSIQCKCLQKFPQLSPKQSNHLTPQNSSLYSSSTYRGINISLFTNDSNRQYRIINRQRQQINRNCSISLNSYFGQTQKQNQLDYQYQKNRKDNIHQQTIHFLSENSSKSILFQSSQQLKQSENKHPQKKAQIQQKSDKSNQTSYSDNKICSQVFQNSRRSSFLDKSMRYDYESREQKTSVSQIQKIKKNQSFRMTCQRLRQIIDNSINKQKKNKGKNIILISQNIRNNQSLVINRKTIELIKQIQQKDQSNIIEKDQEKIQKYMKQSTQFIQRIKRQEPQKFSFLVGIFTKPDLIRLQIETDTFIPQEITFDKYLHLQEKDKLIYHSLNLSYRSVDTQKLAGMRWHGLVKLTLVSSFLCDSDWQVFVNNSNSFPHLVEFTLGMIYVTFLRKIHLILLLRGMPHLQKLNLQNNWIHDFYFRQISQFGKKNNIEILIYQTIIVNKQKQAQLVNEGINDSISSSRTNINLQASNNRKINQIDNFSSIDYERKRIQLRYYLENFKPIIHHFSYSSEILSDISSTYFYLQIQNISCFESIKGINYSGIHFSYLNQQSIIISQILPQSLQSITIPQIRKQSLKGLLIRQNSFDLLTINSSCSVFNSLLTIDQEQKNNSSQKMYGGCVRRKQQYLKELSSSSQIIEFHEKNNIYKVYEIGETSECQISFIHDNQQQNLSVYWEDIEVYCQLFQFDNWWQVHPYFKAIFGPQAIQVSS